MIYLCLKYIVLTLSGIPERSFLVEYIFFEGMEIQGLCAFTCIEANNTRGMTFFYL